MNKYNSKTNTFIAPDLYNLTLPVLPPANMSISSSDFAPGFFFYRKGTAYTGGFTKIEQPYLKSFGLFSNLADGLVDRSTNHSTSAGWGLTTKLLRFGPILTGVIANTAGAAAIVGTGTLFTKECAVSQQIFWYDDNKVLRSGSILTITNDTSITLSAATASSGMNVGNTSAASVYPQIAQAGSSLLLPILTLNHLYEFGFFIGDVSKVKQPRGRITMTAGSTAVTGLGTDFTTDFSVGDAFSWVDNASVQRTGVIANIASATALTLSANSYSAATAVAMTNYDNSLRVYCEIPANFMASTISIDPQYQTTGQPLQIHAMAVFEHSEELAGIVL